MPAGDVDPPAGEICSWVKRVRKCGVDLPIKVGVAGPVERTKLLSMAAAVAREVGGERWRVAGPHIFTLNQVAETEAWPQRLLAES